MEEWLRLATKDAVAIIDAMALIIRRHRHGRGVLHRAAGRVSCASGKPAISSGLVALRTLARRRPHFPARADIIGTSMAPSWEQLGQLGAIAVIRTFLNFFLERELAELRDGNRA
jgi:hypothetical protein